MQTVHTRVVSFQGPRETTGSAYLVGHTRISQRIHVCPTCGVRDLPLSYRTCESTRPDKGVQALGGAGRAGLGLYRVWAGMGWAWLGRVE